MSEDGFEEFEHPADWGLRVRGANHAALFVAAARGMFSLLTDVSPVDATQRFELELEALDTATLLIDWLNELLYLAEDNAIVFKHFTIHELDADHARLRASASGGPPTRLDKTIKAATFSGLCIAHDAHGYSVEIVFDV